MLKLILLFSAKTRSSRLKSKLQITRKQRGSSDIWSYINRLMPSNVRLRTLAGKKIRKSYPFTPYFVSEYQFPKSPHLRFKSEMGIFSWVTKGRYSVVIPRCAYRIQSLLSDSGKYRPCNECSSFPIEADLDEAGYCSKDKPSHIARSEYRRRLP